jgi:Kef-type K+ transport system membrane component KefB
VVGEIVAGVALGPSLLGVVTAPGPEANGDALLGLAQIGLCALLFRVGLETDLDEARRVAVPAALLAGPGIRPGPGVLTPDLFAALALVITATTLAGPLLLRRFWPPAECRPARVSARAGSDVTPGRGPS